MTGVQTCALPIYDLVIQCIFRRNDQHIAVLILCPDEIQQADPIAVRQPDIQQDAVVLEQAKLLLRPLQRIAGFTDITLTAQKVADIPGQLLVVFNDENLHNYKNS